MLKKSIIIATAALAIGGAGGADASCPDRGPPAYLIAHVQVTDPEGWKQYVTALPGTLAPLSRQDAGARAGRGCRCFDAAAGELVIEAFSSMDDLKAW